MIRVLDVLVLGARHFFPRPRRCGFLGKLNDLFDHLFDNFFLLGDRVDLFDLHHTLYFLGDGAIHLVFWDIEIFVIASPGTAEQLTEQTLFRFRARGLQPASATITLFVLGKTRPTHHRGANFGSPALATLHQHGSGFLLFFAAFDELGGLFLRHPALHQSSDFRLFVSTL